jgi:outer membrane protein TolC
LCSDQGEEWAGRLFRGGGFLEIGCLYFLYSFNAVAQAKAAQLPRLSLTTSIGGASNSLSNITSSENVVWQLGTNLLAPIFDGGRLHAQVEVSTAEQKQSLAAYAQAALTAFSDVENSLDQGVVLQARNTELQEAARQASKAYRITKLRYNEGESELLDVLNIQHRVNGAKSNLVSVQRLLLEQRVNLNLALGGSWD